MLEETRPLYYTLSKGLSDIIFYIFYIIVFTKINIQTINEFFSFQNISLKIIPLIGFFIYSEIIILNFCGLDKNTFEKINERSKKELLGLVSLKHKD